MRLVIHTDGAARGNPGPAGIGVVIQDEQGVTLAELGEYIGETTNNVAEYRALLRALEEARRLGADSVAIRADSELLVRQVSGRYRVRHPNLVPLYAAVLAALREFSTFSITHVPRAENARADALANWALDETQLARGKLS
ncbi:MAG TPA: ribonuclease HI family protein [Firmicutes bacterium]|nr:ribonuclease HI family protein [Bacillota bacterium]